MVFFLYHTPDSTSLHYPDPLDEPQKFASDFVLHSPRNELVTEPQITVTPTSVLVNFDASTSHPHPPDGCFLPTFTTATNLLKSSSARTMTVDAKVCFVIKATPNIIGFKWVCPPSKVGSDKKQLAPPGTVQLNPILQSIAVAVSPRGVFYLQRVAMDLDWIPLSRTPYKNWTDQVTRTETMKLIFEKFMRSPVDTQGSLAWKWFYCRMLYSCYGIRLALLDEEIKYTSR